MAMTPQTKKKVYNFLIVPIVILLSGTIRAVIVHMFVVPYEFATSGVTGIGVLIEHEVPWFSAGYTTIILNLPLMILAWLFIGKRLTIISSAAIVLSAIGMILMNKYSSYIPTYENGEPIFAAIAAGILSGIGFAMMIRIGGSTGGSDIIAMLIQKKFQATNISWFVYGVDAVIIFSSIFVFKDNGNGSLAFMTPVMMALTDEFCHAMIGDVILTGFKTALKYEIITDNPEEISQEIMTKLKRGVTSMDATGMYSHDKRALLICIIRKRQLGEFNKILKKYPGTFAYVISAREVYGKGFSE